MYKLVIMVLFLNGCTDNYEGTPKEKVTHIQTEREFNCKKLSDIKDETTLNKAKEQCALKEKIRKSSYEKSSGKSW